MNGIYLHVPFCKRRCIYCDFYSTTGCDGNMDAYIGALCNELRLRREYLPSRKIDSVYIGGGTPSLLGKESLHRIFDTIGRVYSLQDNAEVTIEVNPDDVTSIYVASLKNTPINRVSIGGQSFDDNILKFLNRRHTGEAAQRAVENFWQEGYSNISLDLIYGIPGQTVAGFGKDIEKALSLPVTHLSSYSLMYEEGTLLTKSLRQNKIHEKKEEEVLEMFYLLKDKLERCGWEHYEISNFCKPNYRAKHNSGYWKEMYYLGCGPSAHSYNHVSRCWNKSSLKEYIEADGDVEGFHLQEKEILTDVTRRNEWVMKSLRTKEGIDLNAFSKTFGDSSKETLLVWAKTALDHGKLILQDNHLRLTREGIFISDSIMSDLMETD